MKKFLLVLLLVGIANVGRADLVACMVTEGQGPMKDTKVQGGGIESHSQKEVNYKVYGIINNETWTSPYQISIDSKFFKNVKIEASACTSCVHNYNQDGTPKSLSDSIITKFSTTDTDLVVDDFVTGTNLEKITNFEPGHQKRINLNCGIARTQQ